MDTSASVFRVSYRPSIDSLSCFRYFGRAKDLPGVKELFQRGAVQETEDNARYASFQKFRNNGDDYYGNLDEVNPELVKEEEEMEVEGMSS